MFWSEGGLRSYVGFNVHRLLAYTVSWCTPLEQLVIMCVVTLVWSLYHDLVHRFAMFTRFDIPLYESVGKRSTIPWSAAQGYNKLWHSTLVGCTVLWFTGSVHIPCLRTPVCDTIYFALIRFGGLDVLFALVFFFSFIDTGFIIRS